MKHQICLTTVEALVINKALRVDLQNDVDNAVASNFIDRLNITVAKDLKKVKPTDLSNKCGSCKWAKPHSSLKSYIDCTCPSKKPNFFARTSKACKKYERGEK